MTLENPVDLNPNTSSVPDLHYTHSPRQLKRKRLSNSVTSDSHHYSLPKIPSVKTVQLSSQHLESRSYKKQFDQLMNFSLDAEIRQIERNINRIQINLRQKRRPAPF